MARGDLEVLAQPGVASHADHADDVVGAVEGRAAVGIRLDPRAGAERLRHPMCDRLRRLQPFGVDVVERDGRFAERFESKEAGEQLCAEVDTARPDECDLGHASLLRHAAVVAADLIPEPRLVIVPHGSPDRTRGEYVHLEVAPQGSLE